MKMVFKRQIGSKEYEFVVEGTNLHEVVLESEKLSFPSVTKCGLCESDWLVLKAYETKEGYSYTKIACLKCKGSVTFGQRRDNKDQFFLRKNEAGKLDWQAYTGEQKVAKTVKSTPTEDFSTAGEEEAPF